MYPFQNQYMLCPLCKKICLKNQIQIHYYQCKERIEQIKIQEELKKHTQNQQVLRYKMYMENKQKEQNYMKQNHFKQTSSSQITEISSSSLPSSPISTQPQHKQIIENIVKSIFEPVNHVLEQPIQEEKKEETKEEIQQNLQEETREETKEETKEETREETKGENKKRKKEERQLVTVDNYRPPTTLTIYHDSVLNHFFQLYEQLFINYIKDKSIALVGPAESILGTRKGHIIDKFDLVVRLNKSIPLPKNMELDIGTRTDILYNSLNTSDFPGENKLSPSLHKKYGIKFICSSYPFHHSVFHDDILNYVMKYRFELPFKVMDDKKFKKFERYLGTRPYTGTCAIMDLLSYPIKYLYITGLDFYMTKYYHQYREISKGQLKHTRNSNIHQAKPQLDYLKQLVFQDDRIILDSFLSKIVYDDYEKVVRNIKHFVQTKPIFQYQNENIKQFLMNQDFQITFTNYPELYKNKLSKSLFIITNKNNCEKTDNQYLFYITQNIKEVIYIKENINTNYIGNFYYQYQNIKDVPSLYLHSKFLVDIKNILLRIQIKNPSSFLLLVLSIIFEFPNQHIFIKKELEKSFVKFEEYKLYKFLCKKKMILSI